MALKTRHQLACVATVTGAFLLPALAHAAPCDDDIVNKGLPHPIFGSGGSAVTATLQRVALAIANSDGTPEEKADRTTIFYSDPNACDGYAAFLTGKSTNTFKYWEAGKTAPTTCEARTGGQPVQFAHMGNAADLCPNPVVPAGYGDFPAPIQTVNIITGLNSQEPSISAEALYFIYGFGTSGQVAPWTANAGVFTRQSTAFVTYLVGAHAKVPSTAFVGPGKWAADNTAAIQTNGAMVTAVKNFADANPGVKEAALGFVSGSTADTSRDKVLTLPFRAFEQECAVYPDSTVAALDKINVRKGKYALWAQGHYFTKVDTNGVPEDDRVANLIGWFSGKTQPPGTGEALRYIAFDQTIGAGDIPACAMEALREGTVGAFYSYAPPKPCVGRFEKVATGSTEHGVCEADSDCEDADLPSCNFGYCEAYRAEGQEEG